MAKQVKPKNNFELPKDFCAYTLRKVGNAYCYLKLRIEDGAVTSVTQSLENFQPVVLTYLEDELLDQANKGFNA